MSGLGFDLVVHLVRLTEHGLLSELVESGCSCVICLRDPIRDKALASEIMADLDVCLIDPLARPNVVEPGPVGDNTHTEVGPSWQDSKKYRQR